MANKEKNNCILIRAEGTSENSLVDIPSILPHLQAINLKTLGCEVSEMLELVANHGFPDDLCETGKFYDHEGTSLWYYYVYGTPARKKPTGVLNFVASRLLGRQVFGDVAIVRSGPTTSKFEPWLSIDKLAQTVVFYKTHDPRTIFGERERERFFNKMGLKNSNDIPTFVVGFGF